MLLRERVLFGVQQWYRSTVRGLQRSKKVTKRTFGEWMRSLGCPNTLVDAQSLLTSILQRVQVSEEAGDGQAFVTSIGRRTKQLRYAVESARSRDGDEPETLVCELVDGDEDFASVVRRNLGSPA